MKYIKLAAAALCFGIWLFFGNYAGPAGLPVPALGDFFNPATGFWRNTLPQLNDREGRAFSLNHPLAKGDIFFDDRGVPHVFADDLESACFLQGFVNAADRLWQMDISTRATEGRLSEILGKRTMKRDIDQVRRGFRYTAARETDTMRLQFPDDYRMLEAYSAGVNAWLDQLDPKDYPVEYKLLDHEPLRWSPYRTALLGMGMAQSLSARYDDARTAKTRQDFGPDLFNELFPKRFPRASPIVPDDGRYRNTQPIAPLPLNAPPQGADAERRMGAIAPAAAPATKAGSDPDEAKPDLGTAPLYDEAYSLNDDRLYVAGPEDAYTLMPAHPDNGSNNWAVAPNKSNTRHPMLASDPHLSLTLPSIWYEIQVSYPGVNARGVGLPGTPGIMIGFNDHVAYGETNVGHDVTDWFAIEWTDTTRTKYRLDGAAAGARMVKDTVFVKGQASEVIETPWTVFGPVPYTDGPYADHAMRWLAHDTPGNKFRPHTIVGTFLGLMSATSYEDYKQALRGYVGPAQNFIFAHKDGDIGIRPNGFFPIRAVGDGATPLPGSHRVNNWSGTIPFDARPEHKNPTRGYVSSANQVTTGPNYPYPYIGGFDEYRGRFINRYLDHHAVMNQRTMKELQLSSQNLFAEELTPLLIARIKRDALDSDGRALLRLISEWDYNCEGNSRAASLFELWWRKVYSFTFDEMPRDSGYVRPDLWKWNDLVREKPTHPIFDIDSTAGFRETVATLTQRAFDEILEELDGELPETWAEMRNSHVNHLGQIPGFGSGLIKTGGSRYSPRALSGSHGASWRMVVELGPQPRAWGALPGGPSGHPASELYTIDLDDWENGRYHELVRWEDTGEAKLKSAGHWRVE
ncbi:penicillin acylase family protein [Neolewinella agarilytica]|nr:penicillin acylase family protein [Neolewinella agarilytica]